MKHDTDNSGSIQINEFREIYREINEWIALFNSLDEDHSGKMEYGEFVNAMKRLQFHVSDQMFLPLFQNIDTLHNNFIDLNGFIKVVSILQVLEMKFAMRDTTHSGRITVDINDILDFILTLPI
ncbi:uncharacterized protein [Blastocystis hominis]|uniref:EF-hand domain-containing protein n=1 Tax=Blastocystis hominis TaxID=12968 RepID=D8LUT5_BLAHO|nr:uncharacterized protein [Blastocystis hominis]CBK19574.2 unnamed protein product [Blastocystis hominis]|eukprot:XP_012893622.1 uncharacterized protein [Blastocystis hominis]